MPAHFCRVWSKLVGQFDLRVASPSPRASRSPRRSVRTDHHCHAAIRVRSGKSGRRINDINKDDRAGATQDRPNVPRPARLLIGKNECAFRFAGICEFGVPHHSSSRCVHGIPRRRPSTRVCRLCEINSAESLSSCHLHIFYLLLYQKTLDSQSLWCYTADANRETSSPPNLLICYRSQIMSSSTEEHVAPKLCRTV